MAGRALRKRILQDILDDGGADYLFDEIASGVTVASIGARYGCTRSYVSRAINSVPEYKEAMERARIEAADALVEQGLEMVDALDGHSSTNEISATREKVNYRKFVAGSLNQNRYGTRPQNNVTVNIGDMHLDALKKINREMIELRKEDDLREIDHE